MKPGRSDRLHAQFALPSRPPPRPAPLRACQAAGARLCPSLGSGSGSPAHTHFVHQERQRHGASAAREPSCLQGAPAHEASVHQAPSFRFPLGRLAGDSGEHMPVPSLQANLSRLPSRQGCGRCPAIRTRVSSQQAPPVLLGPGTRPQGCPPRAGEGPGAQALRRGLAGRSL